MEDLALKSFKSPERVSASLPKDELLEKVRKAIEEDQVPIVVSDWNLKKNWREQAENLFSIPGILNQFSKFTQQDNSKFFLFCTYALIYTHNY